MKLFDATLDLAAFAKGTEDYTVSAVNGRDLICNELAGRVSEFGGGTIWIRSGESAGYFGKIQSNAAQTITLSETLDVAAGDEITIGSWQEFDTQKLINAVNSVLRMYKIMDWNFDLEFDQEQEWYELPEGVTADIREVRLQLRNTHTWAFSHYWRVDVPTRTLQIYDRHRAKYESGEGYHIGILYVKPHGAVGKTDEISEQVDPLYLRYMAWLYLCRNLIQSTHKDNLVASDMYNEAKIYERDFGNLPNKQLQVKTMTFPQW